MVVFCFQAGEKRRAPGPAPQPGLVRRGAAEGRRVPQRERGPVRRHLQRRARWAPTFYLLYAYTCRRRQTVKVREKYLQKKSLCQNKFARNVPVPSGCETLRANRTPWVQFAHRDPQDPFSREDLDVGRPGAVVGILEAVPEAVPETVPVLLAEPP